MEHLTTALVKHIADRLTANKVKADVIMLNDDSITKATIELPDYNCPGFYCYIRFTDGIATLISKESAKLSDYYKAIISEYDWQNPKFPNNLIEHVLKLTK